MSKQGKKSRPFLLPEKETGGNEEETEDIYDSKQRERMLDEDEISASEEGFMRGRDEAPSKKEMRRKGISHDDSMSVELAKAESEDS